jgi:CheY-like chemotaxis protein
MIGLRRPLSLLAVFTVAFATPAFAADEVTDTFQQGVDLLKGGQHDEALRIFQDVLAMDPSHEAAYELWQVVEHEIWLKMLVMNGEYELVAKRFMDLAAMGRKERQNDPEAIRVLLAELDSEDVGIRTRVIRTLSADHGEFAVPFLLFGLANQDNGDRRVIFMQTLVRMGADVVPPMIEALDSPDAFLRRNVALTLGYIGDPRANGALAALAGDADGGVRSAAGEAVIKCGGGTDAVALLLAQGNAYHAHDLTVCAPHTFSDVVWHWAGTGVESVEVPRFLYVEEMAKKAYYRALDLAPGSVEALAGVARVSVAERAMLGEWAAAGADAGSWMERLAADELAVGVAGQAALDMALGWSLEQSDMTAAIGLCQALGRSASTATPHLQAALDSGRSGAIRGEAAVALGSIAYRARGVAAPGVVTALGEAASREVLQIAAVIDGVESRRASFIDALAQQGMAVNGWSNGARGLVSLRAIPGVDVILLADGLSDLTLHQVIDEIRRDVRLAETPILIITADEERASELYGDKAQGFLGSAGDLAVVTEAMSGNLNHDRERANELAARAAGTLAMLAGAGATDVATTANVLAGTLAARPDDVVVPVLGTLRVIGTGDHVAAVAAVVTGDDRSDAVRIAGANCLAGIFLRSAQVTEEVLGGLTGVCTSDASFGIRSAVAGALGRLDLSEEMRAEIMKAVRANISR